MRQVLPQLRHWHLLGIKGSNKISIPKVKISNINNGRFILLLQVVFLCPHLGHWPPSNNFIAYIIA